MPYQPPILVNDAVNLLDDKHLGAENYLDLCLYIKDKVAHIDRRLLTFRTEKLPEYVRLYKAKPKNSNVDWPWPGAANLVIPIIGTYSDELLARIMGGIWMYDPLWASLISGDIETKDGEALKAVIQDFLMDMAYSPDDLDLYRVEQSAFHSAIKYGTGIIYTPYEFEQQVEYTYIDGGLTDAAKGTPKLITKKDGPSPELLPLNKFGFDPSTPKLENMKFHYHVEALDFWAIKNLPSKSPYYKKVDIDALCESGPDAVQETEMEKEINESFSIDSTGVDTGAARWYIYTCWFKYTLNGQEYSFQAKYHRKSEKILWITFNNYPANMEVYQDMKLAYDDESYLGTGFAEMLHIAQKEVSNNNNWRTNNRNYAMLGAWRIDPESKLGSLLDVFPGVGIPAKKDEVEWLKTGTDVGYSDGPDQFQIACAKERAGVDPAMGGTGGGIVNAKRGIYSASGTSMVLMQQNNRNSLRTGDMRSAHVKLAMKFLSMYANFGIGDKIKKYGNRADALARALKMYKEGTLGLRLRPASAAMNKELERQNDILLSDRIDRFYDKQAQILQAINTPNIPPALQTYYHEMLSGSAAMMTTLMRNFNKDNTDTVIPDIGKILQPVGAGAGNGNQNSQRPNSISQVPSGIVGQGGVPAGQGNPQ